MEFKDYYSILGVEKTASPQEIQRAYRKLARKYHPDINKAPEAEARFKEIGEAYEALKDPEKRRKYDRYGAAWKQAQARGGGAPPGWQEIQFDFGPGFSGGMGGLGGEGFSSFFEMLFGSGMPHGHGGAGRGAAGFTRRGSDVEVEIALSLAEAAAGGRREIAVAEPTTGERKIYAVNIPKGVRPGQRIRLAGKGAAGAGGGPAGDLYLRIAVVPHPRFKLKGSDLHTTLPVTPWEAALGGEVTLDTLEGAVRLKVPPGSSSGKRIRLRGRGFPSRNGGAGDLYAEIAIVVPKTLSEKEKKLYRGLAEASTFRPRHS